MKHYERQFRAWKEFYQSQKRRELTPPEDDGAWDLVHKQRYRRSCALEKDLTSICRKYGFVPITEDVENWDERWRNTGNLEQSVARALNDLIKVNREIANEGLVCGKTLRRRHGPQRRLSTNLAEVILVGLKLLEGSEPGLKRLRGFLDDEGFPRTGTDDTRKWKDERMHYFKRMSLSAEKKKIIKNFNGCEAEKELLDRRIAKKSIDLVRRSAHLVA